MLAAFFYVCMYVKKADKTTIVQKTRAFNIDEIDTLKSYLKEEEKSCCNSICLFIH